MVWVLWLQSLPLCPFVRRLCSKGTEIRAEQRLAIAEISELKQMERPDGSRQEGIRIIIYIKQHGGGQSRRRRYD